MQEVDPPVQIDPNVWATYEAAHVQAEAAIRAAEIGAQAAWDAAKLQAWIAAIAIVFGLIGTIAVLFVGRWAYHAAIKAAERQTKLENDKHNARVVAYGVRQDVLIRKLIKYASFDISFAMTKINEYKYVKKEQGPITYYFGIDEEQKDWEYDQWENHALLGASFVEKLMKVKSDLEIINSTKKYIIENSVKEVDDSGNDFYSTRDIFLEFTNDDGVNYLKTFSALGTLEHYRKDLLALEASLKDLLMAIPDVARRVDC